MYVCQYGCQNKREDLRNAANIEEKSYKNVLRAKNWNILFPDFSFVFFRISFVYLLIIDGPLKSYLET